MVTKDSINHSLRASESLVELVSWQNLTGDHRQQIVFYNAKCVHVQKAQILVGNSKCDNVFFAD